MSTIAYISHPKYCDFCRIDDGEDTIAEYDAKTVFGSWANMCEHHFATRAASSQLGTGHGQKLIVGQPPVETEDDKRAKVDEALRNGTADDVWEAVGDGDLADYL